MPPPGGLRGKPEMTTPLDRSASHDPGGKTKLPLPAGVTGGARFSPCGRYRQTLVRDWTPDGKAPRAVLFVGQNPSVADATVSDPTCGRELAFARDWGFTRYLKGNVLDWRATSPADVPRDLSLARSPENLPAILAMAAEAETIVLAYGSLHKRFADAVTETIDVLRETGKPLMCFAKNADGAARHPLYLPRDARLIEF